MIPKVIHYCWLSGDKFPEKVAYCINSWKKQLPDYEIVVWDLQKFDISSSEWCQEAFEAKKYAFAADYIRCYALYYYGGIYLDSDVEVIKSFNDLLELPYFIGKERRENYEPAIMGAEKGWLPMKMMLDFYDNRHFKIGPNKYDLYTMPLVMDDLLNGQFKYKLISSLSDFDSSGSVLSVFDAEFFSPKYSNVPKVEITPNTYTVHHFEASWFPVDKKAYRIIQRFFGNRLADIASWIYKKVFKKE